MGVVVWNWDVVGVVVWNRDVVGVVVWNRDLVGGLGVEVWGVGQGMGLVVGVATAEPWEHTSPPCGTEMRERIEE